MEHTVVGKVLSNRSVLGFCFFFSRSFCLRVNHNPAQGSCRCTGPGRRALFSANQLLSRAKWYAAVCRGLSAEVLHSGHKGGESRLQEVPQVQPRLRSIIFMFVHPSLVTLRRSRDVKSQYSGSRCCERLIIIFLFFWLSSHTLMFYNEERGDGQRSVKDLFK